MKKIILALPLLLALLHGAPCFSAETDGHEWKWCPLWSRDNSGSSANDEKILHEGKISTRVEHRGERDWSLAPDVRFDVKEGEIYELSAWLKVSGSGDAQLSVVTRDARDEVVAWMYGLKSVRESKDWVFLKARCIIPRGVATIVPRLTGDGPSTVWMEGFHLKSKGSVEVLRDKIPGDVKLENENLGVIFQPRDVSFAVTDRRTGQTWTQQKAGSLIVTAAKSSGNAMKIEMLDVANDAKFSVLVELDAKRPEFSVAISGDGALDQPLEFPAAFATPKNTYLVIPMNEGISFPVADTTVPEYHLVAYGGHGICMSFFGATDGERGEVAILETSDDASIRTARHDGLLAVGPVWESQKGNFGYTRRILYAFFDRGGHVAMCKRYREYAKKIGKLKTFTEKRRENPNIDLLIGAVNTWCWEKDALGILREMKDAGIDRILWSEAASAETIKAMNEMGGILTSRYDIYQDLMDPAVTRNKLHWASDVWTQAGWPDDINRLANGDWRHGWGVDARDGTRYFCGVLCDRQALKFAHERVPADLQTHPYRCRFIDTTTAAPWFECYDSHHPLTRSNSRDFKMKLLSYMSHDMKLVTGSETGHDAAVPYVDYFEGMLSLGPFRVPDAGRNMQKIWDTVPEDISKYQLGHVYRLPLWELVYHDCVVAQWYWGDYNNKLPAVWNKRDLFNVLYGTPPMFMFNREFWEKNKDRFVASFKKIGPVARATGYSEMLDHKFLRPDQSVQQTHFADGTTVIVNFGDAEYSGPGGEKIPPQNFVVKKQ